MTEPLVSIYTVVYNDETGIRKTIESVLNQTYKNIEYIIVDGGSTDSTIDIIKEYEKEISIFISEKDDGIYDAMNKAIEVSNGTLIGLLNSGDSFHSDAVEDIIQLYNENNSRNDIIYSGAMNKVNDKGEIVYTVRFNQKSLENKFYTMPINHTSTFVPMKVFDKIGVYNLDLKITADYEFILRALHYGVKIKYTNKVLADMQMGGVSDDRIYKPNRLKEEYLLRYKYCSSFKTILIIAKQTINSLLKTFIPNKILYTIYNSRYRKN
ncbi:MAG: glycosyl transferase [Balneola sp.]|jgi:glycosyltransferase involved in cell wall biosynthesis|nr:glycosyl transferase [Balneola sp.]MBE80538.1 glycosyl transferase [Balneola sp.]|tara:strand:+ start:2461 stop:3261 length:801 start_codon:yes stop_codon:yes gene_type:complete